MSTEEVGELKTATKGMWRDYLPSQILLPVLQCVFQIKFVHSPIMELGKACKTSTSSCKTVPLLRSHIHPSKSPTYDLSSKD